MKKIILACDGNNFPKGAFEFVKELNLAEPVLLTGAFLRLVNFQEYLPSVYALDVSKAIEYIEEQEDNTVNSIKHFEEQCRLNGIEYRVHEESSSWSIKELSTESRFADIMIMSEELFCAKLDSSEPNAFMQQAIHRSECPVLLVPEAYRPFERIMIAYDGNQQSMFALRQFCSLLPQFTGLKTSIIYAKNEETDKMPNMDYIKEYAARHFSDLDFEKLSFNAHKHFETWAEEHADALLVTGSYSKPGISTLFKKSFAEDIIHNHSLPVFIAHT